MNPADVDLRLDSDGLPPVGERNFHEFPTENLEILLTEIDTAVPELACRNRVNYYFAKFAELQPEPELVALIGHAICSYLSYCLETGKPWMAEFLFPPQLDPKVDNFPGENVPAVGKFRTEHLQRNLRLAGNYVEKLIFKNTILFIRGPMYSAKSGAAALMYGLLHKGIGQENIIPLIYEGMGEGAIHARSLRNGAIPAEKVNMDSLQELVSQLIETELAQSDLDEKKVVIIEEATFLEMENSDVALQFANMMNDLQAHGISVIIIGLGKNYRGQELLITQTLMENCADMEVLDCTSFHLYPTPEGSQVAPAELTGRYSQPMQMFDWCFQVLAPRELTAGIDYHPLPEQFHPFSVLSRRDPELYAELMKVQRGDLLVKHTEMAVLEG